jgi:drug/metabolite transporter (DMT)-like permease
LPAKHLLFALLAVCIWSGNTIVSKLAAGAIPPGIIAFDRWCIAFLLLTPFQARAAWRHRAEIARQLPRLALLGLLGMAMCQGLGYYAAGFTTATNMALLLALVPLLTLLVSAVFLRDKPPVTALLGGLVSLLGIVIVLGQGRLLSQGPYAGAGRGDALMLIAVLAYATYGILLRRWTMALPAWTSIYVQVGAAVLLLLPCLLLDSRPPLTTPVAVMVLYAAIPGSIVAPFAWMAAVKRLGAGRTAIFMNLIPILTAAIAAAFLGEALRLHHLLGGGLTLAGILLVQHRPAAPRPATAGEARPTNG